MAKAKPKYPLTHHIGNIVTKHMLCGRYGGKLWFAWDDRPRDVTCKKCKAARRAGQKRWD